MQTVCCFWIKNLRGLKMNSIQEMNIEGRYYRTGLKTVIKVCKGLITEVVESNADGSNELPYIAPGLVDIQINGFKGINFNTDDLNDEDMVNITRSLLEKGVTSYCPTIITNSVETTTKILDVMNKALNYHRFLADSMIGVHLEGPFISPVDGPRGAHPREFVVPPNWDIFKQLYESSGRRVKLLTMSPEWTNSSEFIRNVVNLGIKVAIGHTSASSNAIAEAALAGATLSTHLGNGTHLSLPRHPNYIWDQLSNDDLWASMIVDGFHLPESVVKVVLRVKQDKAFLVSDSVYLAGLSPGRYQTHIGGQVILSPEGRLYVDNQPKLLAGAAKSLKEGVEYLVHHQICSLSEAWDLASTKPAKFMGMPASNGISIGDPADCCRSVSLSGNERLFLTKSDVSRRQ